MRSIRTKEEIKQVVNNWSSAPLFFSDTMHVAFMLLCQFLDWDDIPPAYQRVLEGGKATKESWDSDDAGLNEISILDEIDAEVKYLRKIIDADKNPAFWRLPRLLALLWLLGEDERVFKIDTAIVKVAKSRAITIKKTRDFIKTLASFV